jgi:orotate phosphoribosyltransferase
MPSAPHTRLIALLRELSVRRGTFTLASGAVSDLYVDARQTTLHAEGAALVGALIRARLKPEVVGVGGMTLGADPIATAVSVGSWGSDHVVHAFLIRKQPKGHGTARQVEGMASFADGAKVCVVEDTTTTGGSLLKAVEAARAAGLDVVQTITVVDREEGAREALAAQGLSLEALVTREQLLAE